MVEVKEGGMLRQALGGREAPGKVQLKCSGKQEGTVYMVYRKKTNDNRRAAVQLHTKKECSRCDVCFEGVGWRSAEMVRRSFYVSLWI